MCHWLCSPDRPKRPDLVGELQAAGRALRLLLAKREVFDAAVAASNAGDAAKLGAILRAPDLFQLCYLICEWFCSWRCVLVCLTLCRQFPLDGDRQPIHEAFEFARRGRQLAQQPAELQRLSVAIGAGDARTYGAIVEQLKLQRFCMQLCHWICMLRCRRFCSLVCPPIFNHPWFTHVGDFGIYGDIDAGTGLTEQGAGRPRRAELRLLRLPQPARLLSRRRDPANPGAAMAYRFLFQAAGRRDADADHRRLRLRGAGRQPLHVLERAIRSRCSRCGSAAGNPSPTPPTPAAGSDAARPLHRAGPAGLDHGRSQGDRQRVQRLADGVRVGVAFPGGAPAPGVDGRARRCRSPTRRTAPTRRSSSRRRASARSRRSTAARAPDYTNQLGKIHINNWSEVTPARHPAVPRAGRTACSPLTNDLDILYTTDHELMAAWSIDITTAATIPPPAPVYPSGTGPRGGSGTDHHDISHVADVLVHRASVHTALVHRRAHR